MEIVRAEEIHLESYTKAFKQAIALGTTKIEMVQGKLSEMEADPKTFLAKHGGLLAVEITHWQLNQFSLFTFFALPILLSKKRIRSEPIMAPML